MQVTFQAPPFGVRILDDPPPRGGQVRHLRVQPGLSRDVFQGEACAPHRGAEQLLGTGQLSPVPHLRDGPAGSPYRGHGPTRTARIGRPSRPFGRLPGGVDERAVVAGEEQRQTGVVDALGQ
jgi:hypothetical protein